MDNRQKENAKVSTDKYFNSKVEYAYALKQQRKFFKKVRSIIIKDGKVLVIKVSYKNGDKDHYLLPGGGVDDGETVKQAAARESLEEYGVIVKPAKYLGCQYYSCNMNRNGEIFKSNRVEYYYLCEYQSTKENSEFGVGIEFKSDEKTYEKTALSLSDLEKLDHNSLNNCKKSVFDNLISYLKEKTPV